MKTFRRIMCCGIASALALPVATVATAHQPLAPIQVNATSSSDMIALASRASGLTERQVSMVLGNRSAFAGYQTGYDVLARRFRQAVGPAIYENLEQRHDLTAGQKQELSAAAHTRTNVEVASK
ncbi:MAG: hypothetical protein ACREPL_14445 [Rhodanobacteraceae bacterium]